MLEFDVGVGKAVGPCIGVLVEQLAGGFDGLGVDDELGVVFRWQVGGVGGLEPGRGGADELGHGLNALVGFQDLVYAVGDGCGAIEGGALGQEYLDGELVAVGEGHHSDGQPGEDQAAGENGQQAAENGQPGPAEGPVEGVAVPPLDGVEHGAALFLAGAFGLALFEPFLDEDVFQIGDEDHGEHEGGHQGDGDGPREVAQEVEELPAHGHEQGEEDDADAEGGEEDGTEVVFGAGHGGVPPGHASVEVVEVGVDDDDGVVDDHPEHDDQGGEGHGVQGNAADVHDADGDEDADGDGGGGDNGGAEGEEDHHHENHYDDGNHQVAHEGGDGLVDDFRLVGDALDLNVGGQFLLEGGEDFVDFLAVLNDVVAFAHLHGEDDGFAAVAGDVAVGGIVFADDAGDVAQADDVPLWVGVDDLLGDLVFGVVDGREVDGEFLPGGFDGTAGGGEALGEEPGCQGALVEAVDGEFVGIKISGNLLFLQAVPPQVRHGFDPAQPPFEVVEVLLEFAVGFVFGLQGDQQGGGVAEVVVHDEGEYAGGKLHFEAGDAVLDLGPHFVFVVDVVVQLDHDVDDAVLREGVGLGFLDFFVSEEEAFEGLGKLLFDFGGGGAGVDPHHEALPDGEGGKFLLGHHPQPVDAECDEKSDDQEHDPVVAHAGFYDADPFHNSSTLVPSLTFCIPSTITRSPLSRPWVTVTPLSVRAPMVTGTRTAWPARTHQTNRSPRPLTCTALPGRVTACAVVSPGRVTRQTMPGISSPAGLARGILAS